LFRSIRWRIAVSFGVFLLICIAGLSSYLVHYFHDSSLDDKQTSLTNQALLVADSWIAIQESDDNGLINSKIQELGAQINAQITIVDDSGNVLVDSEQDFRNQSENLEIQSALTQGVGRDIRTSDVHQNEAMYVAIPVESEHGSMNIVRVSGSLTEINQAVSHVNMIITLVAISAAVITIFIAFQISKITSNPVKRLTQMAKHMAEGELDQEIQVGFEDEVSDLAKAFNLMSLRVKDTIASITAERDRIAIILSNMADGIIVVDRNGRLTLINKAAEKMLGITMDESQKRSFVEVVRDYELNGLLHRCIHTGKQQKVTVELNQGRRFIGVMATPLEENSGCLLLLQDLTELRRLETVRRDFVSNISHELRTPVASLKALAETLREGAIDDPSVAQNFLGKIDVEVDKLAQMIQELGDLSRIESGEAPMKMNSFDMDEVVRQAVNRLQAQADRVGLHLGMDGATPLPEVYGDKARIEQVLVNLIHNAIKFTPPKGTITVSTKMNDNKIHISVSDTGIGIPAGDLSRIFERFYKADKARTGGGTGLGLAIAKHVVEGHGGKIWAESIEGKGSTFHFTIPVSSRSI